MCMFSAPVEKVSKTCIYVTHNIWGTHQVVVYANTVSSHRANLMILPVRGSMEKVRYINMERVPEFFDVLKSNFPTEAIYRGEAISRGGGQMSRSLPVEKVGSYEASFAPTFDDLELLDVESFGVIAPEFLAKIKKQYTDEPFGFVVCKLRVGGDIKYHPFAYEHRLEEGTSGLFVPTRHIHGGAAAHSDEVSEDWDHDIYWPNAATIKTWKEKSSMGVINTVITPKMAVVDGFLGQEVETLNRIRVRGYARNDDLIVTYGEGVVRRV